MHSLNESGMPVSQKVTNQEKILPISRDHHFDHIIPHGNDAYHLDISDTQKGVIVFLYTKKSIFVMYRLVIIGKFG